MPLTCATGVLPIPLGGLGAFEWVLDTLYQQLSPDGTATVGQGFIAAMGYRLVSLAMAIVGVGFYFATQQEIVAVLQDATSFGKEAS